MTARAYLRVSSAAQVEKFSLAFQREKALAFAAYQDLKPVQFYEERGVSGQLNERPQLTALFNDLRPSDTIIIYSLSRLGRGGAVQLLSIVGRIKEAGARLVSLTENIDSETPAGRLMLTILAALAELEVETTRERTAAGRLQAASQGIYPQSSSVLPAGYGRGPDGRIIETDFSPTVQEIFRRAAGGTPFQAIADSLNKDGIVGSKGKNWYLATVRGIVQERTYMTGELSYRRSSHAADPQAWMPIPCPPLVSEAVWQAAQRTATKNHVRRDVGRFPLSGKLFCACGSPLSGSANKSRSGQSILYYRCSPERRGTPVCPATGKGSTFYPTLATDTAARLALEAALRDSEVLARLMATQPIHDDQAVLRRALEARRDALIDLHLEGLIDRAEFTRRREEMQRQLEDLRPNIVTALPPDLSRLAEGVPRLDAEEYQQLLSDLGVQFKVKGTHVEVCALNVPQLVKSSV
ncbi:recombinase family protein [Deinococcus sp. QL22]|uniref:recombinase family protein n=1 Tax=Deinococcus sp. QL22 TaxID=2939437 RepID=UPI002016BF9D|nr:recombinase family protein [Deinococcus sp. QL22]UQN06807.1 recombinase family protein [Deinococcus sp. QL22]